MSRIATWASDVARSDGAAGLVRKLVVRAPRHTARYVAQYPQALLARRELRRRADAVGSTEDALEVVSDFRRGGLRIASTQVRSEIVRLLEVLRAEEPRTVLEIGTAEGGTLFLVTRVAAPDALLVTVDLARGFLAGSNESARRLFYAGLARERQRVRFVAGDSQSERTRELVARSLGGREVDFLFIDGDHSYDGVVRDYDLYSPFVRSGGLIAFHDIVPYPELPEAVGGVPEFWQELKERAQVEEEIVGSWDQGGFGIGLVRVP